MSGPKTVLFGADPFTVLLSAAAIRAAAAIREGQERAAALHASNAEADQTRRLELTMARRKGTAALEAEVAALEARFESLNAVARSLGGVERLGAQRPARPASLDAVALGDYITGLASLTHEMEALLLTEAARLDEEVPPLMPELSVPPRTARETVTPAARILARIEHLGPCPADLERLARELDETLPGERQALLTSELRRQVQLYAEQVMKRLTEEATATIVAQSLKDLGYQVEDIPSTLFVSGGVAHFRRRDWGDYMVRMRVDEKAGAANFNVIRAIHGADTEPSVMDHLAEDRWCTEFPKLIQTLEARGALLTVTRRLAAGELPVQRVQSEQLPQFADEKDEDSVPHLHTRALK